MLRPPVSCEPYAAALQSNFNSLSRSSRLTDIMLLDDQPGRAFHNVEYVFSLFRRRGTQIFPEVARSWLYQGASQTLVDVSCFMYAGCMFVSFPDIFVQLDGFCGLHKLHRTMIVAQNREIYLVVFSCIHAVMDDLNLLVVRPRARGVCCASTTMHTPPPTYCADSSRRSISTAKDLARCKVYSLSVA